MESLTNRIPQQSNFRFLPSTIIDGKKFRTVANKIYATPLNGTFHQFLEQHAIELIGDEWWIEQESKCKDEQSCLFKWADEFYRAGLEIKINSPQQKMISIPNTGTRLCWMLFCYDLLCLEHRFALPKELIARLKDNVSFQSARYELAIAAMLVRADFDIVWIKTSNKKSCELIATHRKISWSFGVEVKSKRYPGILNEAGQKNDDFRRLNKLLKKALKQVPENTGYLIFIDQNLDGLNENKLINLANSALKNCVKESSKDNPNPFSSIVFTNFPFHYLDDGIVKYAFACPPHPKYPMPAEIKHAIEDGLYYYSYVPSEI
jgi:hypothetical protein